MKTSRKPWSAEDLDREFKRRMASADTRILVPDNPDVAVSRYMSLFKYVDLLSKGLMYFAAVEQLQDGDPYEFSIPDETQRSMLSEYRDGVAVNARGEHITRVIENYAARGACVNCWYIGPYERQFMWDRYAPGHSGLCVWSTFKRLRVALETQVQVGLVEYTPPATVPLHKVGMYKRKEFAEECELRAIVQTGLTSRQRPPGWMCAMDLGALVERVVLPPGAPAFYFDCVRSLHAANDLSHVEIVPSALPRETAPSTSLAPPRRGRAGAR